MGWPLTTTRQPNGQLAIGGISVAALANEFGTPLYIYDEATLRHRARSIKHAFEAAYPRSRVVYAGKAGMQPAIVSIIHAEGLGLDVVSGGEIYAGQVAGVDPAAMTFHGNNKSEQELREALNAGVGLIAIDNDHEIGLLHRLTAGRSHPVEVLLRVNPGVEAHTNVKMRTGVLDSKFGLPIATGAAASAVARITTMPSLRLAGYHAHIGSQVFDADLVRQTLDALLRFAAEMRHQHGVIPRILGPGGGFGVADNASGDDVSITAWATAAATALATGCAEYGFDLPELHVEPGRAIVGPAGVALYRVGARKEIPGVRTYVSVDGGMADNIRPTLYNARYSAALANRIGAGETETVAIAGKFCESGDVLIEAITLPRLEPDDLLAVPMAGAYCLAMASNYNLAPRPAAIMVAQGTARLIRRREQYADLLAAEMNDGVNPGEWRHEL